MTSRKNWKASYLRLEKVTEELQRAKVKAEQELAVLKRPKKWHVAIGAQHWNPGGQSEGRDQIAKLVDCGAWHIEASGGGTPAIPTNIEIAAQSWHYEDYDKAREQARRLLDAGLWFISLTGGAQ